MRRGVQVCGRGSSHSICAGLPMFTRIAAAVMVGCLSYLSVVATAHAAPKPVNGFIGGQFGIDTGGLFRLPRDVAVYTGMDLDPANDKVFVISGAGGNNSRVDRLDVDGNFERAWGKDVVPEGPGDTGTGFEVCTVAAQCQRGDAGSLGGEFDDPMGIAINQATAHVYVRDRDNRRVQEFDLDGSFVRAWGWDVVQAGGIGDDGISPVNEFEICAVAMQCQAGSNGAGAGQFASSTVDGAGIAVSPTTGDVFAADPGNSGLPNRRILQFSSTGSFARAWGYGIDDGAAQFQICTTASGCGSANVSSTTNGQFANSRPLRIAIDLDNVVYASDTNDSGRVIRFDADLVPAGPTFPNAGPASSGGSGALLDALPSSLLGGREAVGLEIDSSTGELLVAQRRSTATDDPRVLEIADPGAQLPPGGPPNPTLVDTHVFDVEDALAEPTVLGLGYNPTSGNIYLAVAIFGPPNGVFNGCTNPAGPSAAVNCHGLIVLASTAGPVEASAEPPADVGATTAEVAGVVNAGGGHASYRIEVSRNGVDWIDASGSRLVSGSADTSVSVSVSGLEPNSLYRVRLRASKQVGMDDVESVVSAEQIVLTDALAPDVETLGSAKRTETGVQLRGRVDPNNASTSYRFEYGLAGDSFDKHVPVPDGDAGAGGDPRLLVQTISGLQPDTLYQYRVVAENFVGESLGDVVTFRTRAARQPVPPDGRAYELVSPAEKVGGVGAGSWYHSPSSQAEVGIAAYTGERFGVQGMLGSVLTDGGYAYATDWALAQRTPTGWTHQPAMTRTAYGRQSARFLTLAAVNEDFSLMLWGSNSGLLRLFPELELWDETVVGNGIYARDWEGNWEIVGPTDDDQATGGPDALEARALSSDGSLVAGSSILHGLAGDGDPTLESTDGTRHVVVDDISLGLSNTFPGEGVRSIANVCTNGTLIPHRLASGKIDTQTCQAPLPGLDARLIDPRGASISAAADRPLNRAVSQDGRKVFFVSPDPDVGVNNAACSGTGASTACPPQLYVRQRLDNGDVVTRWISRSEVASQDASLLASVSFESASRDGDKVFFRSAAPLTEDDPNGAAPVPGGVTTGSASSTSVDLFMYDFPDALGADPSDGDLVRISAGPDGDGDGNVSSVAPGRAGALRFVSMDGSRLYFTSTAPLSGVPLPSNGTVTSPGGTQSSTDATNLYFYDANVADVDERWRFVARLPRTSTLGPCATTNSGAGGTLFPISQGPDIAFSNGNCVKGTEDGSFVTFWTDGGLTLDDVDPATGDLYGYDAIREELTRISEPQGGVGGTYPCAPGGSSVRCFGDGGFGSYALQTLGVATDPSIPGDRLAFFQSRSRLVPQDHDSAYDVYQWRNGELSLLTVGGSDADGFFYQGNDRSGRSVFFSTLDRMTWQDHDAVLDVYVARAGGGFAQPPGPVGCDLPGGGCHGPDVPKAPVQVDSGTPGSGNANVPRLSLELAGVSKKARARAARSGVLAVKARVSGPGLVAAVAKTRLAGKRRTVARASDGASKAGAVTLRLRLNSAARRRLASGRSLRLAVSVVADGARAKSVSVTLKKPKKAKRGRR
jgi:hypothetical protein